MRRTHGVHLLDAGDVILIELVSHRFLSRHRRADGLAVVVIGGRPARLKMMD
jgi:hypothetical protein